MVWVFARHADDKLASLVIKLDGIVAANSLKQAMALTAVVGDDPEQIRADVKSLGKQNGITNVILAMPKRHDIGDRKLRLADDAEVTVMVAKDRKIVANHAFKKDELNDAAIQRIAADFDKVLK